MNSPSGSKRGVSLLEVMIGIAIASVLLALVLGSVSKIVGVSKRAKCVSNLRQVSQAFISSVMDHNGVLPYYAHWYSNESTERETPGILDYLGFSESDKRRDTILTCPALQDNPETRVRNTELYHRNYSLNLSATSGHKTYSLEKISLVQQWSSMVLVFDGSIIPGGTSNSQRYHQCHAYDTAPDRFQAPHSERLNACFLDGHVETMTVATLLDPNELDRRWMKKAK